MYGAARLALRRVGYRRPLHTSVCVRGGGENIYNRGKDPARKVPKTKEEAEAADLDTHLAFYDGTGRWEAFDYIQVYRNNPRLFWADLGRLCLVVGGLIGATYYFHNSPARNVRSFPIDRGVYGKMLILEDIVHTEELTIRQWDHDTKLVDQLVEDFNNDPNIPHLLE